jgi:hypothetical protein
LRGLVQGSTTCPSDRYLEEVTGWLEVVLTEWRQVDTELEAP